METKIVDEPDAGPHGSGAKRRSPYWVATVWGAGIGALAFGLAVLLALPMRPKDPSGFEDLGWFILTALFAAAAALVGGSVGTWRGLSRGGYSAPVLTGVLVVPAALVLGAPTAGVGALAAPAVAVWLAGGLKASRTAASPGGRGLWQRLTMTVVLCAVVAFLAVDSVEGDIRPVGNVLVWGALLVIVGVGAPPLLLRRVLPSWVIVALMVLTLGAGVGGNAYLRYVNSQPNVTIDELARLASGVGLPEGTEHVHSLVASVLGSFASDPPLPARVSVAVDMRNGSYESRVLPPELSPGPGGQLPPGEGPRHPSVDPLSASSRGKQIAAEWERLLLEDGWAVESGPSYEPGDKPFWLPTPAGALVAASDVRTFSHGVWVRAVVLPHEDGAILVMAVRR
jgi:hypothetical protein